MHLVFMHLWLLCVLLLDYSALLTSGDLRL